MTLQIECVVKVHRRGTSYVFRHSKVSCNTWNIIVQSSKCICTINKENAFDYLQTHTYVVMLQTKQLYRRITEIKFTEWWLFYMFTSDFNSIENIKYGQHEYICQHMQCFVIFTTITSVTSSFIQVKPDNQSFPSMVFSLSLYRLDIRQIHQSAIQP